MRFIYILLAIVFVAVSCDNELDTIEDYKDIPVVYGFISLSDTAQYIRVERAFVDESQSAFDLAQNPDSLYYMNATVELVRESTGDRFPLEMVDGNMEGYVRDEGVFANQPNYLFKIRNSDISLIGGESYTLSIDRGDAFDLVEASTVLLDETRIKTPNPSNSITLAFNYISENKFIWQSSEAASIHDLYFRFNYRERSPDTNGEFVSRSALWQVASNLREEDTRVDAETVGVNFFTFLRGAIDVMEDTERRFEDMDMIVVSGGEEIEDFVAVSSANLGITSTQDVPTFTNIPGGRGIFSSTNTVILDNISLSPTTIDSIKNGIYTKDLGFTN